MDTLKKVPEKYVWSLEKFQQGFPNFPINVIAGQVAINANLPVQTDMVICAHDRVQLVPDLANSLTAQRPVLERVCPIPECETRAIVGAKKYDHIYNMRQSWFEIKKRNAADHLTIHGPANKTSN
ncbi:MAG: hypothetical protein WAV41_02760 [Microgenomates group bacterium]